MVLELVKVDPKDVEQRARFLAANKTFEDYLYERVETTRAGNVRRFSRGDVILTLHFLSDQELVRFCNNCGYMLQQAEFEIDRRNEARKAQRKALRESKKKR